MDSNVSLSAFRFQRAVSICGLHSLELLVASLPENVEYLSGFFPVSVSALYSAEAYLVFKPSTGEKALITSAADAPTLTELGFEGTLFPVGSFCFRYEDGDAVSDSVREQLKTRYDSVSSALVSAITALKFSGGRIAMDESRMPVGTWNQVRKAFPDADFIEGAPVFRQIKYIKHPDEVALIKKSTNITEASFQRLLPLIRRGISEEEMCQAFYEGVTAQGAAPYFCTATVDKRSAFVDTYNHPLSTVKEGSVIRFDFGCIYKGFRSDIARTVITGENEKAACYYRGILEGEEAAISALRPGATAGEIFDAAVTAVRKTIPHYDRHHCGHGIGLACYDLPSICPGSDVPIEKDMVLCIETPYYELGWGGVQVEDTVLVTERGAEYLTESSRELIYLEV
ncbi:Xaa-Pro peptidase family protein [Lacrimispora sp. NSJ-141]|uniref:Xaa-Pro peptidase family protein n=1 Tax=Lientehia hominis TaxID=2897778 RepID=A0AAP2RHB1_9FIRM|nr:Xaa-Pro peptidase family protein [Lientehia hominis]MCD2491977.1 Xaa-Pro peptidase family protein [Lientehia hominis]